MVALSIRYHVILNNIIEQEINKRERSQGVHAVPAMHNPFIDESTKDVQASGRLTIQIV